MSIRNRSTQQTRVLALIAGIQKHLPSASLTVDGSTFTGAQLVQALQDQATAIGTVTTAKAAWQAAVQAANDSASATFTLQLTQAIRIMYASSVDVLADFGMTPRKAHAVDPATRVAAAAKARATRVARHTMGKNQKKDIKGTVATSAPAPATPSVGSTPSTSAGGPTLSH